MLDRSVFAIDFGTTKFCIAALRSRNDYDNLIVETISVKAEGMRRGMVADIKAASEALGRLLDQAENQFGEDILKVSIGVAGSHLRDRSFQHKMKINGKEITQKHVEQLTQDARESIIEPNLELLHIVPIDFQVDQRETITNPIGFSGLELSANFFAVFADRSYVKDLIKICNSSGLEVSHVYSEPFASSTVTLEENAKNIGVAIVDIGGGTSDGIVYQNGKPSGSFTINIGGKMFTQDLAVGLGLSLVEAERVKLHFGVSPKSEKDEIVVSDVRGLSKKVTWKDVSPILAARLNELAESLFEELKKFRGKLAAGIVLTGGGAELRGIERYFNQRFSLDTHKSFPLLNAHEELESLRVKSQIFPTKYATVIGLLNLEIQELIRTGSLDAHGAKKFVRLFYNWLRELS